MKAKEEAKELVDIFKDVVHSNAGSNNFDFESAAKECALICVDDELKILDDLGNKLYTKLGTDSYMERCVIYDLGKELEEVRQEINKL